MLLAVPGTALAAPPANDNRAAAEAIPAFPHTLAATTAEATVERLDPQVSRCGRIESTLWYRIDTAPDGLIALTVKGAAGVAPVLRIYRRTASAIQEVDCSSAGPGGSASASLEAVRGSSYLVLVGRRPSTPDGGFQLRAELFLPPANDNRAGAQAIAKVPGSVRGTTLGATGDEADPSRCGLSGATSGTGCRVAGTAESSSGSRLPASSTRRSSCSSGSARRRTRSRAGPRTVVARQRSRSPRRRVRRI